MATQHLENKTSSPLKTKWGPVKFGIGFCVVMLPILLYVRSQQAQPPQISALVQNPLNEREVSFINADYLTLDALIAKFEPLSKAMLVTCKNVQKNVDDTERRLCQADPHLAAALKDPRGTPFAGPNFKSTLDLEKDTIKLVDILIEDYLTHTKDLPEKRDLLVPILKLTMVQVWTGRTATELSKLQEHDEVNADPLLCYCIARASTSDELFLASIEKGARVLSNRPTDPLLNLLMSVNRLQKRQSLSSEVLAKELIISLDAIKEAIRCHADNEFMLLAIYPRIQALLDHYNCFVRIELAQELQQLKNPACPEWVLQGVCSSVCDFFASKYRGTSYISQVPPDQLMKFEKFAATHATHLLRAWSLQPGAISFHSSLIRLELRAGNTGRTVENWLRHSLAIRLVDPDTVDAFTRTCEPRWGGSLSKFLWFSDKCADCLDAESELGILAWFPLYHWCIERGFAEDLSEPTAEGIAVKMIKFLKARRDDETYPKMFGKRSATITRILWDAGRLDELHWFLKRYHDTFSHQDLNEFLLDKNVVTQVSNAANGEGLACWSVIHANLLTNSIHLNSEALAIVSLALEDAQAIQEMDEQKDSKRALETCWKLFDWAELFHSGQTVHLGFEGDGLGWLKSTEYKILNEQSIELTGQVDDAENRILPMLRFPPPYSVEADFHMTDGVRDITGLALQAGATGRKCSVGVGVELRFMPSISRVAMDRLPHNGRSDEAYQEVGIRVITAKLRLELRDRQARGFLDDNSFSEYLANFDTFGLVGIGRQSLARGAKTGSGQLVYRVSNVRIVRLDTEELSRTNSPSSNAIH